MDLPQTPDIFMSANTEAYLRHYVEELPLPDQVIRSDKDEPTICIFDWEKADAIAEATDRALIQATQKLEANTERGPRAPWNYEAIEITRFTTLKHMLAGMKAGMSESIDRVGELPQSMGVEM